MKKTTSVQTTSATPVGENYVLTLVIPKSIHEPKYQQVLSQTSGRVTIPGFRKGKAPLRLVEEQIGASNILDKVLEDVLPAIYADAVTKAGISPLVPPQVKITSINPKEDWTVEAHTALAPKVTLGEWKKIVKEAGKTYAKDAQEHAGHDHAKEMTEEDKEQQLLTTIFEALIKHTNPAIPPLLIEHEAKRQIEDFARNLATHRIELEQFLQSTGKTVEGLQQEYMISATANMQVEFTIQAVTNELQPEVNDQDLTDVLGKEIASFPKENQARIKEQATEVARRKKTLKKLTDLAKES